MSVRLAAFVYLLLVVGLLACEGDEVPAPQPADFGRDSTAFRAELEQGRTAYLHEDFARADSLGRVVLAGSGAPARSKQRMLAYVLAVRNSAGVRTQRVLLD